MPRIRKEYIVLVSLSLLLLAYIFVRQQGRMHYDLPSLPVLQDEEVTSLVTLSRDEEKTLFSLEQREGVWYVLPEDFRADPKQVEKIKKLIASPSFLDMVSSSESYQRYELDEASRLIFQAKKGESTVRELIVGKTSPSASRTFILVKGDPHVYSAEGNWSSTLLTGGSDLRDKVVLKVDPESVIRVTASGDYALTLAKGDKDTWVTSSGGTWESEKVQDLLTRASSLKASSFLSEKPSGDPLSVITFVLSDEGTMSLSLFEKTDDGYPAVSSREKDPFLLSSYITEKLLATLEESKEGE